jgi:hypothetical protein
MGSLGFPRFPPREVSGTAALSRDSRAPYKGAGSCGREIYGIGHVAMLERIPAIGATMNGHGND